LTSPAPQPAPLRPGQRAAKPAKAKPLRQNHGGPRLTVVIAPEAFGSVFLHIDQFMPKSGMPWHHQVMRFMTEQARDLAMRLKRCADTSDELAAGAAAGRAALRAGSREGGRGKR
jgi:hypothetical protein